METQLLDQVQTLREERDTLIDGNAALKITNENLLSDKGLLLENCSRIIADKNDAQQKLKEANEALALFYKKFIDETNSLTNSISELQVKEKELEARNAKLTAEIESKIREGKTISDAVDAFDRCISSVSTLSADFEKVFYGLINKAELLPFDVREWLSQYNDIMIQQKERNEEEAKKNLSKEHNLIARETFARRKENEIKEQIEAITNAQKVKEDK